MDSTVTLDKRTYAGLFMVALATLMYETLLTRIFSVTMWYHFAFVAISVSLFGMTVGGMLVYLLPSFFSLRRAKYHLALSSLLFAISVVISFLSHLSVPFIIDKSVVGLYSIAFTYLLIAIPFVFSGICICLALTKFTHRVSKLYAANLAGSSIGCLVLMYTLRVTDGPTAVIVAAFLASVGALFFCSETGSRKLLNLALISSVLLTSFAVAHTVLANRQSAVLRLMWVKGKIEYPALYEKWNSFSRVRVEGDPDQLSEPFGWGLSSVYPTDRKVQQLYLTIDATAGTMLTKFDGDFNSVDHLKYDVTNIVHYIRPDSKVLAVGTGGGRDILSALAFDQKSVVGVEINADIVDAANKTFGDFTGHLDRDPRVTFVVDEARSYVARSKDEFDILQVSFADTWAATAAGAFVLAENSLYTVDAWEIFLEHLSPRGVLTFSRWYFRDRPGEIYRLATLASDSLMRQGIQNPRDHIVIVRQVPRDGITEAPVGVGTILVSNEPFSDQDLNTLEGVTNRLKFDIVLSPRFSLDSTYATIASGENLLEFTKQFPLDITPPTDDKPFFFHMLRFRDLLNRDLWAQGANRINMKAVFVLGVLLLTVVGLTLICIIGPLALSTEKAKLKGASPLFIYFASIGLGFMLVEISQMQRLNVFLGHPTYGLSVVLFTLLLSSGLGSYLTRNVTSSTLTRSGVRSLLLLLGTLAVFGALTPYAMRAFQEAVTPVRILVATAILFPLGLFMGTAFPIGMKVAASKSASLTPWLWGINGSTSVCASVLATLIALGAGISVSFWTGFCCYVLALGAFVWASRGKSSGPA